MCRNPNDLELFQKQPLCQPRFYPPLAHPVGSARRRRRSEDAAHVSEELVDPESFLREVEDLHASDRSFQDELQFKDGRIFSRRSVPFHVGERFQFRIWIFTDVTEARHSYIDAL